MHRIGGNAPKGAFPDWTAIDHPQTGEAEIGGLDTACRLSNPPLNESLIEKLEKLQNCWSVISESFLYIRYIRIQQAAAACDGGCYDAAAALAAHSMKAG